MRKKTKTKRVVITQKDFTVPDKRSAGQCALDRIPRQKTRGEYLRKWIEKYGDVESWEEIDVNWKFVIEWALLILSVILVYGFLAWSFMQLVRIQF